MEMCIRDRYKIEVSAPGYEGPDGEASLTKVFVPSEDSTLVFSLEKVNEDKNPSEGTDKGDSDNTETGGGTGCLLYTSRCV